MDVLELLKIEDQKVEVFSSGYVVGKTTAFQLEQLAPAQAVALLMSRGWQVSQLGDIRSLNYVCRKES